jgi:hypothetical protein
MALQIRRGTEAERTAGSGVIFAEGELVYITDTDSLYVGDGSTAGGVLLTGSALAAIGSFLVADTINSTLDLQQDLDLNGNDLIGTGNININGTITATGNINIGDNENTDTVDFTAKITSTLTPQADSTYDIGTISARWQNGYFTGLVVDGQVDAVSVNADVVADNSTVMVDVSANTFTGNLTGDVTGNVSGNVTGDLTGNVSGNTTGYHTGDVKGSVFGDDSSPIVDAVANQVRATGGFIGDVTGNLSGNVKASNGNNVLVAGTNGLDANYVGSVQGNVTGSLSGTVTGSLIGNSTGFHTGDVKGSIFSDGSEMLIDGVAGRIIGPVFSDVTGNVTGDLTGSVLGAGSEVIVDGTSARFNGTLVGDVITNNIDSSDSSEIVIIPQTRFNTTVLADQEIWIGGGTSAVDDTQITAKLFNNYGSTVPGTILTNRLGSNLNDPTELVLVSNSTTFEYDVTVNGRLQAFGERAVSAITRSQLSETNTGFFVVDYTGDPNDTDELQDINNYTIITKIVETIADFGTAVKFASMDDATRNALTAEVGMVIFNTTSSKLQVCTGVSPTVWETITSSV